MASHFMCLWKALQDAKLCEECKMLNNLYAVLPFVINLSIFACIYMDSLLHNTLGTVNNG